MEPSNENFQILKSNCDFQFFSTKNIILLNYAIADKICEVDITCGLGAQNTIIFNKNYYDNLGRKVKKTEKVKSITISSLIEKYQFDIIDFLKIDIEGAEPLLYNCIERYLARIRAIYIEISWRNTKSSYIRLLEMLFSSEMKCFSEAQKELITIEEAVNQMDYIKGLNGINLWFIREQRIMEESNGQNV